MSKIAQRGSIQKIRGIPADIKKIFITAFDVKPREHLYIQGAFQKHTDNSVSKTVNLPAQATVEEVSKIYLLAHALKCKGITIYRYGSKKDQVLSFDYRKDKNSKVTAQMVGADSEYSGGCAAGACPF